MILARLGRLVLKVKVKVRVTVEYRLTAVIVRYYRHVLSSTLARRGVWRGAAEASTRGGVQRVWAW